MSELGSSGEGWAVQKQRQDRKRELAWEMRGEDSEREESGQERFRKQTGELIAAEAHRQREDRENELMAAAEHRQKEEELSGKTAKWKDMVVTGTIWGIMLERDKEIQYPSRDRRPPDYLNYDMPGQLVKSQSDCPCPVSVPT